MRDEPRPPIDSHLPDSQAPRSDERPAPPGPAPGPRGAAHSVDLREQLLELQHDINNPLAYVLHHLERLGGELTRLAARRTASGPPPRRAGR